MRCNNKIHCKYGLKCSFSHTFEEQQSQKSLNDKLKAKVEILHGQLSVLKANYLDKNNENEKLFENLYGKIYEYQEIIDYSANIISEFKERENKLFVQIKRRNNGLRLCKAELEQKDKQIFDMKLKINKLNKIKDESNDVIKQNRKLKIQNQQLNDKIVAAGIGVNDASHVAVGNSDKDPALYDNTNNVVVSIGANGASCKVDKNETKKDAASSCVAVGIGVNSAPYKIDNIEDEVEFIVNNKNDKKDGAGIVPAEEGNIDNRSITGMLLCDINNEEIKSKVTEIELKFGVQNDNPKDHPALEDKDKDGIGANDSPKCKKEEEQSLSLLDDEIDTTLNGNASENKISSIEALNKAEDDECNYLLSLFGSENNANLILCKWLNDGNELDLKNQIKFKIFECSMNGSLIWIASNQLICAYNICINNIIILNTYSKIIYTQHIINYIIYAFVQILYLNVLSVAVKNINVPSQQQSIISSVNNSGDSGENTIVQTQG